MKPLLLRTPGAVTAVQGALNKKGAGRKQVGSRKGVRKEQVPPGKFLTGLYFDFIKF